MIRRCVFVGVLVLLFAGCGGNPYLDASLDPAKFEGKDQVWFEENWGEAQRENFSVFWRGELGLFTHCWWRDQFPVF